MKHLILALSIFAFSGIALASGKLSIKPQVDPKNGESKYSIGLSVYEKIVAPLAYKGWFGGGANSDVNGEDWFKTEQGVEFYYKALAIGVGGAYTIYPESQTCDQAAYGTVGLSLW